MPAAHQRQQLSFVLGGLAVGAWYIGSNRATLVARAGLKQFPEPEQPVPVAPPAVPAVPIWTPSPTPAPTPPPAPPKAAPPLGVATPRTEPKADKSLDHLHSEYRKRLDAFLTDARKKGFRVLVYECYRTPQRQAWLWSFGRSAPNQSKAKVTWTLDSMHRYGLAADLVCLKLSGAADWSVATYNRLHTACPPSKYGLELVEGEKPHLQLAGGQARAAALGIRRDWRVTA